MALATQEDVEAALGRDLSESESNRAESLLRKASALVIGYTGQDFESLPPYSTAVVDVVADMVARAVSQAGLTPGLESTSEAAGPFNRSYTFGGGASGGVWLSSADKMMLRPYRRGGGVSSVQMVGERYDITPEA